MKYLSLFLCLFLLPQPARAEIPLDLVAEIQLPDSTVDWDVQHWMDDSTFGWVATRGDSIVFSVDGLSAQSSLFEYSYPNDLDWLFENVRIVKLYELNNQPAVMAVLKDVDSLGFSYWRWAVVFELGNDTLLRDWGRWETGIYSEDAHFDDLLSLQVFPRLPLESRFVAWVGTRSWHTDGSFYDTNGLKGKTWVWRIHDTDTLIPIGNDCNSVSFFESPPLHALTNSFYQTRLHDQDWFYHSATSALRYVSTAGVDTLRQCISFPDDYCPHPSVLAQTESDGTEQAIVSDGSCYRVSDGSLAWQLEDELENYFVGRIVPHGSQEVFVLNGARFNVLDASTGTLYDSTATLLGTPRYFLQSADGIAEIVTYQQNNRTVRVYRPDIDPITASIVYLPTTNSIRLRWTPIPGAASYRICRSNQTGDEVCADMYYVIGGTSLTLPVSPTREQSFYSVRAVFE